MSAIAYKVRQANKNDISFIIRTILTSYLAESEAIQRINKDSFLRGHNKLIQRLINSPDNECLIACDTQDESLIFSFILYATKGNLDIIHYLYTRKDFRGMKLADKLITIAFEQPKKICVLTHLTDKFKPAKLKKYSYERVYFDPYITEVLNGDF